MSVNKSHHIVPLSQSIDVIFQYGFQKSPLTVAFISGLLLAIGSVSFLIVTVILTLAALFYPFKYGFIGLIETAHGKLTPPILIQKENFAGYEPVLKQLFILIIFMAMVHSFQKTSPTFAVFMLYAGFLIIPAMIMTMGITHRFGAVFDVETLVKLIKTIGVIYALLCFLMILLYQSKHFITSHLIIDQPAHIIFVFGFFDAYCTIILFHLMGYLLYQHHQALGNPALLDQQVIADKAGKSLISGVSPLFDQFIAENNQVAALEELKAVARLKPDDLKIQKHLESMLKASGDQKVLFKQSEKILGQQLKEKNYKMAAESYLILLKNNPENPPLIENDKDYLPLAEILKGNQQSRAVVKLLKIFQANFPSSNEKPAFFLFAAQVLSEDLNREDKAIQLLDSLIAAYPRHPLRLKIMNYKKLLEEINKVYK